MIMMLLVLSIITIILMSVLLLHEIIMVKELKEQARLIEKTADIIASLDKTLIKGFAISDEKDLRNLDKLGSITNSMEMKFNEMEASMTNFNVEFGRALAVIEKSVDILTNRMIDKAGDSNEQ